MGRLVDTNRFVVRFADGLRADEYYPRQEFWLFRDASKPIPTMTDLETLILLQRLVREPLVLRITITRMTPDLETRLRAAGPKGVRSLDSFLTKERGGE